MVDEEKSGSANMKAQSSQYGAFEQKLLRVFGLVLIAAGLICSKFFIFDFLDSVRNSHVSEISVSTKLILLPPILGTMGIALLFGKSEILGLVRRAGFDMKKILLILLLLIPTFAVHTWVNGELEKLGYQSESVK